MGVAASTADLLVFPLLLELITPTAVLPELGLTAVQWACVAGLG